MRPSRVLPVLPLMALIGAVALALVGAVLLARHEPGGGLLVQLGLPAAVLAGFALRQAAGQVRAHAAAGAALTHAAAALGLDHDGEALVGTVDGTELSVARQPRPAGPAVLVVRARVLPALDAGLRVGTRRAADPRRSVRTGDDVFDARYAAMADEPARGRTLISGELRRLLAGGPDTEIDDDAVVVSVSELDAQRLAEALRYAAVVAREVQRAARATGCAAWLRELCEHWRLVATEGLEIGETPLRLQGSLLGVAVRALSVRDGFEHFHIELEARYGERLGVGLGLRPRSSAHDSVRIPVGDPAFDKLFAVTLRAAIAPEQLLDAPIRMRLLMLRGEGLQLCADDERVWAWLGWRRDDPAAVGRVLPMVAEVASRLEASSRATRG